MHEMAFDFVSLSSAEGFWDKTAVWLSGAVFVGVLLEIAEFDTVARWTRLDRQETFALRHGIIKSGLLILLVALAGSRCCIQNARHQPANHCGSEQRNHGDSAT
jgi:uncharacterized membrane protein